jgi:prophage regulatory protein
VASTILKLPAVKARTALSRSTVYNMISRGDFPSPVRLGPRAVGWLEAEVEEWIATRERSAGASQNAVDGAR